MPWHQICRLFFCRLRLLYNIIISETLISLTHVIQVMGLQQFWTKTSLRAINQTIDFYAQNEMLLNCNILTSTKQEMQQYRSENWMFKLLTADKLSQQCFSCPQTCHLLTNKHFLYGHCILLAAFPWDLWIGSSNGANSSLGTERVLMKAAFQSVQSLLDQMTFGRQKTFCYIRQNKVICFIVVHDVSAVMCRTQPTKPLLLCTTISTGILESVLVPWHVTFKRPVNRGFKSHLSASAPKLFFVMKRSSSILSRASKWLNFPVLDNVISD